MSATIENAIRAWVKTGSGLTDEFVIWANQNGPRPARPFITISLGPLVTLGAADAVVHDYSAARAAGAEVRQQVRALRSFTVMVQAFTASALGDSTARALLLAVQTKLRLPSVLAALAAAYLTPFEVGSVEAIPEVLGTTWEGRAKLDVAFYAMTTAEEFTGYISTVEMTNDITDPGTTFEVP